MVTPTPRQILDVLGGYRKAAVLLKEDAGTVHNWTREGRGIPAAHWSTILSYVAKLPKDDKRPLITLEALQAANPNTRAARRSAQAEQAA